MPTSDSNPDTAAAREEAPRNSGTHDSKDNGTEPSNPDDPIATIRTRIASIVNHELERIDNGEIEGLSEQQMGILPQLASVSVASGSAVSLSECNNSTTAVQSDPIQSVFKYLGVLSAQQTIMLTPNDVRSLPRLNGSADVDVAEVLSHLRLVVGFQTKYVAPDDDKFADNLAFEYLSLICHGPCLTL